MLRWILFRSIDAFQYLGLAQRVVTRLGAGIDALYDTVRGRNPAAAPARTARSIFPLGTSRIRKQFGPSQW
jgi:hypothetical protein